MFLISRLLAVWLGLVMIGMVGVPGGMLAEDARYAYGPPRQVESQPGLTEALRNRLEFWIESLESDRQHRGAAVPLMELYEAYNFKPFWTTSSGINDRARRLENRLNQAETDGLKAEWYQVEDLAEIRNEIEGSRRLEVSRLVDYELLLTESFYLYAFHLKSGRLDPETLNLRWVGQPQELDLVGFLLRHYRQNRLLEGLEELNPPYKGFRGLRTQLQELRDMLAEEPVETPGTGPTLRRGDRHPDVASVRTLLGRYGYDRVDESEDETHYDFDLFMAVEQFQQRHGLEVDGVIGPRTRAAMNRTLNDRIQTIELNMERWRWLPRNLGNPHVLVNIAGFQTKVIQDEKPILSMRSVVGRFHRQTPVFSDRIRYLVFNPSWNVPNSIAVNDILPQVKEDPDYLRRLNFRIYDGWGPTSKEVNPEEIDWSRMTARNFPYRFQQQPGPLNALGQVKFMFPNTFNVYLHDTPTHALYDHARRDFSSGCIRVEGWMELADFLLGDQWDRQRIQGVLDGKNETTVSLPASVPVHLQYWTVWIDEDGSPQWRDDIYDRDGRLSNAFYQTR